MDTKVYWRTEDPSVFQIGNRRVSIKKMGRAQAEQIADLNRWLKEHIAPLTDAMKGASGDQNQLGWQVFSSMMGELTVDAQMDLAKVILGKSDLEGKLLGDDFFDTYYDIDWVVDGLEVAGRSAAAQRVLTAFFTNAA